jgi:hypothetical protein
MEEERHELLGALDQFCKAAEEAGVQLPENADPCKNRNQSGLPGLSAGGSGGGGIPSLGGGKKGCAQAPNKWQQHKAQTAYEAHGERCDELGCISWNYRMDEASGDWTMEVTQTTKDGDGDGRADSVTRDSYRYTKDTGTFTVNHTTAIPLPREPNTAREFITTDSYYRDGHVERHRQMRRVDINGDGSTTWTWESYDDHKYRPKVDDEGRSGPVKSPSELLDDALNLMACQLNKQERYVDDILRTYGGSLKDLPTAEELAAQEKCQRPDENSAQANGDGASKPPDGEFTKEQLPCPGEGKPEDAAPSDRPGGNFGGGGADDGFNPKVPNVSDLEVPDALKRMPCVGPNVDCAASVLGFVSGTWLLRVATTPIRAAGRWLADKLWPW